MTDQKQLEARPERVTHEHEQVTEAVPLRNSDIPYAYVAKHLESAQEACCKDVNNLTFHTEKTDPALPEANKAVIACTCGRKHVRFVGGSVQL